MKTYYPIVTETEPNGAIRASVLGLPVSATAGTVKKAEQLMRAALVAFLDAHPNETPTARVARVSEGQKSGVHIISMQADALARRRKSNGRVVTMSNSLARAEVVRVT